MEKPPQRVRKAIKEGDEGALRAMGRRGAEVTNTKRTAERERKKAERAILAEIEQEKIDAGMAEAAAERRDDLLPEGDTNWP